MGAVYSVPKSTFIFGVQKHLKGRNYAPFVIMELVMGQRIAAFVDAGYFWVQVCTSITGKSDSVRGDVVLNHHALHQKMLEHVKNHFPEHELLRVYWYDGPDMNGVKSPHHQEIDRLDDFKLRLGTRNGVGQQKGVDGLIIADLISLTQQKSIDSALLISGDADIAPGVIAAQSMGARIHLLTIGSHNATSPALLSEVDKKHLWSADDLRVFAGVSSALLAAASALPMTMADIARSVHEELKTSGAEVPQIGSNGAIPKNIDTQLLRAARNNLGRNLDSAESKSLRNEFAKLTE